MLLQAFVPSLYSALGLYLPLIVVNCIILGRAEMFASKHGPLQAAADGLGMGLGFTASLVLMSAIRELLGAGTLLGVRVLPPFVEPMLIMVTPAGGFAVLGLLIAASVWLEQRKHHETRAVVVGPSESLCAACPLDCGIGDPTYEDCAKVQLYEHLQKAVIDAELRSKERDR
jgi:electron transport complex protein RnfE